MQVTIYRNRIGTSHDSAHHYGGIEQPITTLEYVMTSHIKFFAFLNKNQYSDNKKRKKNT